MAKQRSFQWFLFLHLLLNVRDSSGVCIGWAAVLQHWFSLLHCSRTRWSEGLQHEWSFPIFQAVDPLTCISTHSTYSYKWLSLFKMACVVCIRKKQSVFYYLKLLMNEKTTLMKNAWRCETASLKGCNKLKISWNKPIRNKFNSWFCVILREVKPLQKFSCNDLGNSGYLSINIIQWNCVAKVLMSSRLGLCFIQEEQARQFHMSSLAWW